MKHVFGCYMVILFLTYNQTVVSQTTNDSQEIEATIKTFFEGFHKRDTIILKSVLFKQIHIQTIKNDVGTDILFIEDETVEKFLNSIVSIPENLNIKEVLHDYQIQSDGLLATAWTPYSFFVNDTLSHCGTNSFQLIKDQGIWKIISIIDTRKKDNCKS